MAYPVNIIRRAEQILGYGITDTPGERYFIPVDGVVYTDLFEGDIPSGLGRRAFNGKVNGVSFYNEIILSKGNHRLKEIVLELSWGSCGFNDDIDGLLAWLQDNPAADNLDDAGVASKKIEDFSVSFRTSSEKQSDISSILNEGYGFYIRKPLIISIGSEQRDASRYF